MKSQKDTCPALLIVFLEYNSDQNYPP